MATASATAVPEAKIDLSALKTQQCVYIDWYKFKQCTIRTCKNYSSGTVTRCLAIDRVQPMGNKIISDAELHLFKFPGTGVSTRLISIKRKKAVTRVKCILILQKFIEYIRLYHEPDERYWSGKLVERLELDYPLRVMRLGYMNWMLPYLTSRKTYAKFASKNGGECEAFKIHTLLGMTEMKFKALRKSIKTPTSETKDTQNHEQHGSNHPSNKGIPNGVDRRSGKVQQLVGVGSKPVKAKRHR